MNPFFIIVFLVYSGINSYIFYRGWQALPDSTFLKVAYCIVFFILFGSFFVAMGGRSHLPIKVLNITYFIGTTWLAIMLYSVLYFLLTDIIHLLDHYFHFLPPSITPTLFHRIQVISGCIIVAAILIPGYFQFRNPDVVEKNIVIHKNGGQAEQLKVALFSDLHLGMAINKTRLKEYVELINEQQPDIILIPGDLIDNSVTPLNKQRMYEELNQLNAPLGIYFSPGNHEYISGIEESLAFLEKTKFYVLMDSAVWVNDSFWIIGRDDRMNSDRASVDDLVKKADKHRPIFLLDHQPYHLEEAERNGIDLQVSGHTHNGQLWPFNWIVDKIYELGHGYKKKGNTHVYVSSGLALWGPEFRVGTQSELVVINIKFEE